MPIKPKIENPSQTSLNQPPSQRRPCNPPPVPKQTPGHKIPNIPVDKPSLTHPFIKTHKSKHLGNLTNPLLRLAT